MTNPTLLALTTLLLLLASMLLPRSARAHGIQSGYLEVRELQPGHATIRLTAPSSAALSLHTPEGCRAHSETTGLVSLACEGGSGLAGREIGVDGLGGAVSDVAAWAEFADGSTASALLSVDRPSWTLPRNTAPAISIEYVRLGLRHILSGPDHLLFLLLLVLALRKPSAVLLAETGFTLSHSLAFSATALGWLQVPSAPVEACIALSLLLLALDVSPSGAPLPARQGALLALAFGLVHGLGFAGGLEEAGLPSKGAAWALLGFGAGVEIGQVGVLVLALAAYYGLTRGIWRERLSWVGTYAAGSLAGYWFIARSIVCIFPS
jgi:hypothetical protein